MTETDRLDNRGHALTIDGARAEAADRAPAFGRRFADAPHAA